MKEARIIAVCALLVFCCCSFSRGDEDRGGIPSLNSSQPATASPPQKAPTAESGSLKPTTIPSVNTSSHPGSSSNNATFSPSGNDVKNNTANGTTATPTPVNDTKLSANITDSQNGSALSGGDNTTLPTSPLSMSATSASNTVPNTPTSKANPQTSTAAPPALTQAPSASKGPLNSTNATSTSPETATVPAKHKPSAAATKSPTTSSTTTTTTTTTVIISQATDANKAHTSTSVKTRTHEDKPSELYVGDEDSSTSSMNPLLAALVSVFVVAAAIISLFIFLKFRHRNQRPEFRRLQDLPMDDMMEDTPLSMYNY